MQTQTQTNPVTSAQIMQTIMATQKHEYSFTTTGIERIFKNLKTKQEVPDVLNLIKTGEINQYIQNTLHSTALKDWLAKTSKVKAVVELIQPPMHLRQGLVMFKLINLDT